jgi:hypothetical protein
MNTREIEKMLHNIHVDYLAMGRKWNQQDMIIIDTIMHLYYVTDWLDWEECKYLFMHYIETGILDFPEAQKMARKRLTA